MDEPAAASRFKRARLFVVVLVVGLVGFGAGSGFFSPPDDDFFVLRKNFQIFGELYEELVGNYVEPVDAEHLMRTGIEAMLKELDPYTTFIDEADNADIDIITRGRYGGVGLNISRRNGRFVVTSPVEGASGFRQGIRTGDVITAINDNSTEELSSEDVRNLLRGEPGTIVEVTVRREGQDEELSFALTREEVALDNVTYRGFVNGEASEGLAYVRLERFTQDAGSDLRRALRTLDKETPLEGIILDLRDNPGGLLDAAVEVTSIFVPEGSTVVSTKGRAPQTERTYRSRREPLFPDTPVVVLVNEYSASASEIVAGALQDLDRGLVVGQPTFGKGLVQVIRPLSYNTSLKMTVSKYYTPSGRSIQTLDHADRSHEAIPDSARTAFETAAGRTVYEGRGIEPDLTISPGQNSELENALIRDAAFFFFASHFAAEHDTVGADFEPTEETLAAFRAWLDERDFSYQTRAERSVENLKAQLAENTHVRADEEVDALITAVRASKQDDFERHKEDIRERLRSEILSRYLEQAEQVRASLEDDVQYQEAVELLRNDSQYLSMLTPE